MKRASKIILINPEEEILLYLRDNKPWLTHPEHWDLIGGRIEQGENSLDTIIREIKEEINCKTENVKFMGTIYIKELNEKLIMFKGNIDVPLEDINLTEGQDIKYFKPNELHKLKFPYFYKDFIIKNKEKIFK